MLTAIQSTDGATAADRAPHTYQDTRYRMTNDIPVSGNDSTKSRWAVV
jgi:hypothetical protein